MLCMGESHKTRQGPGLVDVAATEAGGEWVVRASQAAATGHDSQDMYYRVSTLHMLLALFSPPHYAVHG